MLVTLIRPTVRWVAINGRQNFVTNMAMRHASVLSANYKLNDLWQKRFDDPLLTKVEPSKFFTEIMTKLNNGERLYAVDLDIFVNTAKPGRHLEESVYLLGKFRKSLRAHTMLPSTHHAICRLFLESDRLPALVDLLDQRIDYGVFPDHYTYNLMLDKAIESDDFCSGARIASLIMFQEEFGLNKITDILSLYNVLKYIESDIDCKSWSQQVNRGLDEILGDIATQSSGNDENQTEQAKEADEDDEEDIEYIRVPFLTNEYFDDHFDLTQPKLICGKTLTSLMAHFNDQCTQINYVETQLLKTVESLEADDIDLASRDLQSWPASRDQCLKDQMEKILKMKRIREIEEKKRMLQEKEQYLYFYENLRKRKVTKIEYK